MLPHVMLLTQFFYPDESAISRMGTDLAEDLVTQGFRVTVIAARGTYLGGARLARRERHSGIEIIRPYGTSLGKRTLASRLLDYSSYSAGALAEVALGEKPDVIVAMSTPPFVPLIAACMRTLRGIRFVYWAQDLYPELAITFGLLDPASITTRLTHILSARIVKRADSTITVGDSMVERLISKGARPAQVHMVPNWADPGVLRPIAHADNEFRTHLGVNERKVVLYSGNMGRSHDMDTILGAAQLLRDKDLTFLFIGDGAKLDLVARAARTNSHIRHLPYQPRELLSQSLSAGDLHVVTQEANTAGCMEASKFYGVMAVGRPVLFIGPKTSEVARTIRHEGIGAVVANGDVNGTVEAISKILEEGVAMGQRARTALETRFGRFQRTTAIGRILASMDHASPKMGPSGDGPSR